MIWNDISKKFPQFGRNILYSDGNNNIGIINWDEDVHYAFMSEGAEEYLIDFYDDLDFGEFDVSCIRYWIYPSQVK